MSKHSVPQHLATEALIEYRYTLSIRKVYWVLPSHMKITLKSVQRHRSNCENSMINYRPAHGL